MAQAKPKSAPQRPLSPHLQVWRWHATMLTSILHRATGMALYVGTLIVVLWLFTAMLETPAYYTALEDALHTLPGQVILFGYTFALMFHACNGVRHLVWDSGAGFAPKTANTASIAVIVAAVFLTVAVWIVADLF
jgi:succinate dehydrogenase subunit C (EC 1.3.5.1)